MGRKKGKSVEDILEEIANKSHERVLITADEETAKFIASLDEDDDEDEDEDDDYTAQSQTEEITFIEFAMLNSYLHSCYKGKHKEITITSYGQVENINRVLFGGLFENTGSFWFMGKMEGDDNEYIFQTKMYIDNRNELNIQFNMSVKKGISHKEFDDRFKKVIALAFNNSEYKGKCIKVKLRENRFKGIEIIDIKQASNELILKIGRAHV